MNVKNAASGSVTVALSRSELALINNALNEVCNGVRDLAHDGEFASRLGATRGEARALLAQIHDLLQMQ